MLCIGMRKFLISFFVLFITVPALAELFDFCSLNNCVAGCTAVKSVTGSVSRCVSCSEGTYTIDPYKDTCTACKYISFEGETHTDTSKWDVCSNTLIDQQSSAQETQSVARSATRLRVATSARAGLNDGVVNLPGAGGSWEVNPSSGYEYNGKGCVVTVTPTMPGTSEYGCKATIQCGPGRYWSGSDYGCIKCYDVSENATESSKKMVAITDTYEYVEFFNGSTAGFCKECKYAANTSHNKCTYKISRYSLEDSNNPSIIYKGLGDDYILPAFNEPAYVSEGSYFAYYNVALKGTSVPFVKELQAGDKLSEMCVGEGDNKSCFYDLELEFSIRPTILPCLIGHYCPGGLQRPQECPDGLTTKTAGAKSADECGVKAGVTVFEDSKGTFKLPGTWFASEVKKSSS